MHGIMCVHVYVLHSQIVNELIQFEQDELEKEVKLVILDDGIPESDEMIFVYLTEATG